VGTRGAKKDAIRKNHPPRKETPPEKNLLEEEPRGIKNLGRAKGEAETKNRRKRSSEKVKRAPSRSGWWRENLEGGPLSKDSPLRKAEGTTKL